METIALNEFRRQVGEYVNQTYYASKAFTLMKGTKKVGALVPMATLDRLAELEALFARQTDAAAEAMPADPSAQ